MPSWVFTQSSVAGVDFGFGPSETVEGAFYQCGRCGGWVKVDKPEDCDTHVHEAGLCDSEMVLRIMES